MRRVPYAEWSVAVAFGYFETLFNLRDTLQVHNELLRIKQLSHLLDQVGQQEHLYEIFVEATEQVFTQVSEAIQNGVQDESFLVEAFNIDYNSSAVITHFRVSIPPAHSDHLSQCEDLSLAADSTDLQTTL